MAKKDDITLIIAKSLSRPPQPLSEKEKDICCNLTTSKLVIEHCLTDIQSDIVMKWCALQKANIAYESKEDLLGEGVIDFFRKKGANKYNKIIKSYIVSSKKNEDDEHIALFLNKLSHITTYIQKRGLATFEKKSSKNSEGGMSDLLDRAVDRNGFNDKISAFSEDLKNLDSIVKFVKSLHDAIPGKAKISSAKRKIKEVTANSSIARADVNKPRRKISSALLTMSNYTKREVFSGAPQIKRAANSVINVIAKNNNIKKEKHKKELSLALKDYLGSIYKELESIHKAEKESTVDWSL